MDLECKMKSKDAPKPKPIPKPDPHLKSQTQQQQQQSPDQSFRQVSIASLNESVQIISSVSSDDLHDLTERALGIIHRLHITRMKSNDLSHGELGE